MFDCFLIFAVESPVAEDPFHWVIHYWVILAAVAGGIFFIVKHTRFAENILDQLFLRRSTAGLDQFFAGERSALRGSASLITEASVDFATDYVSLVLVTHYRTGAFSSKRAIEVEELLASKRPVVVVSGPGSGKSTLLKHIHYRLLAQQASDIQFLPRSIPIFLTAEEVVGAKDNLRQALVSKFEIFSKEDALKLVDMGLSNGWFVVLIDAVDEVTGEISRFLERVSRFVNFYSRCHVVMASRPISYDLKSLTQSKVRPFREIAISPLSPDKKKTLVRKYAHSEEHACRVLRAIDGHEFLQEITRVTINLLLLVETYTDESATIRQRSDFYRTALRTLLHEIPRRKGTTTRYSYDQKMAILSHVSFDVMVNGLDFTLETVAKVSENCGEAESIFSEIIASSGLVKCIASGRYGFPHRTFAEYLAAHFVVSDLESVSAEYWLKIFKQESSEVLAFIVNLVLEIDPVIIRIYDHLVNHPRLLACCLANANPEGLSPTLQQKSEETIWAYLRDSQDVQAQSSDARYILGIIHRFPRREEFRTLYLQLIDQLTAPEQMSMILRLPVDEVQTQALHFLVHTNSPEIVPRLVNIFDDANSDTYVRFKAGELLANLSTEELLGDLMNAYENNVDDDVRRFVTQAIVRTKSIDAIPLLRKANDDRDPVIADLAMEGIRQIEKRFYLEDATIIFSDGEEKYEKRIIPGSELTSNDVFAIAMDLESNYRLDAFFQLHADCPEGMEGELFELAVRSQENEFFRNESVRLLGTRRGDKFAEFLKHIFRHCDTNEPCVGAGARGCAIEYLAHRKRWKLLLKCIDRCDVTWRLSSEKCKIAWAIWELVRLSASSLSRSDQINIENICSQCNEDTSARVHHWVSKTRHSLAG